MTSGIPRCELQDVVPHPVSCLLVGHKRFIRALKHADGDNHIQSAIDQIVTPEALQFAALAAQSCPGRVSSTPLPSLVAPGFLMR